MESLYRKYRPLTFDSVVGQRHIVSTLEHAVAEGRLSHAYLFCGPRGTGKTTMARILAKALLCQQAEGARAQGASGCMPDGTCPECEAIAAGTHPDVYELDAASRTGVDNVREEIINSVSFAPVRGAYKVYIIDEVHMLSPAAFNALLKTLEEPPAHVVFILCTTDPQKILETILSRCQRFDFHRISMEDIEGRLHYVCEQEGFECDEEALQIVARHARGGMRDALSTLEQLSVFGDGAVRVGDARSLLGEASGAILAQFSKGIATRDVATLFGLVRAQVEEGNDLLEVTRDLVSHMRDVYTARVAGTAPELFDCPPENIPALGEEASCFETSDRLARILTVLDDAAIEMRNASDPRLVLEIALTRLSRSESDLTLEALAERLDMLEAKLSCGSFAAPAASSPVQNREQKAVPQAAASANGPTSNTAASWNNQTPAPQPTLTQAAPKAASAPQERSAFSVPTAPAPQPASSASQSAAQPAHKAAPVPAPALGRPAPKSAPQQSTVAKCAVADAPRTPAVEDQSDLQRKWNEVVKRVTAQKAARGALLLHARAQSDDGSRLAIELPAGSVFAMKMLQRADSYEAIVPVVCEVFGSRTVEYVMSGAPAPQPTPAAPVPQPGAPAPQPTPAAPSQQDFAPASAPVPEVFERPVPPVAEPAAPAAGSAAPAAEPAASAVVASRSPFQPPASSAAHAVPATPAPASQPIALAAAPATETVAPSAAPMSDADERAPWEGEQVPYDDAMIGEANAEEPPSQEPASDPAASPFAVPAPAPAPAEPALAPVEPASSPQVDEVPVSAPAVEPVRSTPAPSSPFAASPFGNVIEQNLTPQTVEEGKDLLNSVFGEGVVFKSVDN